ncbi:MAG: flagellar hook-length control protein FliK [Pikeienuella sp.]
MLPPGADPRALPTQPAVVVAPHSPLEQTGVAPSLPQIDEFLELQRDSVARREAATGGTGLAQIGIQGPSAQTGATSASSTVGVAAQPTQGVAELPRGIGPQLGVAIASGPVPGKIEIQLDPPELGRVEIAMDIVETGLRATLTAERPSTMDLMRRHLDLLVGQFEEAGFGTVDLRFGGQSDAGHPGGGEFPEGAASVPQPEPGEGPAQDAWRADGLDLRL